MSQHTIKINGVLYDATTGMRLAAEPTSAPHQHRTTTSSHVIHAQHTQKSSTLNRTIAAKHTKVRPDISRGRTANTSQPHPSITTHARSAAKNTTVKPTTHPLVSKFNTAKTTVTQLDPATHLITPTHTVDIAPQMHPLLTQAHANKTLAKPERATSSNLNSKQIKQRSLTDALKQAPSHTSVQATKQHRSKKTRRVSRFTSLITASLSLLLLAGYFTYVNMPNISVRVAASQAGINATYPNYRPDGYSLSGPIAYNNGQVSIKFASTGGNQSYTITQSRSNWDSSAVQQNYATPKWGNDTSVVQANGLTIYKKGSNAAWVNGGILYTISGDAPLSNDQTTSLATSL